MAKRSTRRISKTQSRDSKGAPEGPVTDDQRDRVYRGVLDDMIDLSTPRAGSKGAQARGTEADIDAQIARVRSQFQTDAQFQQALAMQKMTLQRCARMRGPNWVSKSWWKSKSPPRSP